MAFGGTPTGDQATQCRSYVEVDALTMLPDPTTGFAFEIWMHIKIMILHVNLSSQSPFHGVSMANVHATQLLLTCYHASYIAIQHA